MSNKKNERIAVVPGSFDPITVGHLDILKRTARTFDKVWLALMINPSKEYFFDVETRLELAKNAASELENVEVIFDDGMLWELSLKLDCDAIVKGVRDERDMAYEAEMALYNKEKCGVETIFLPSLEQNLVSVSSTLVRDFIKNGELDKAESVLPRGSIEIIKKRGFI